MPEGESVCPFSGKGGKLSKVAQTFHDKMMGSCPKLEVTKQVEQPIIEDAYSKMLKREGRSSAPQIGGCPVMHNLSKGDLEALMKNFDNPEKRSEFEALHKSYMESGKPSVALEAFYKSQEDFTNDQPKISEV